MWYTCAYVPWLICVRSWKSPSQIATDINFYDKARSLGALRTAACFPLWPGCMGREPLCLQLKRYPCSNRFEEGLADSRRSFHLLAMRREQMSSPQAG
jgi:hypothetical protein